ncbi:NUDIX hydrolase [Stieleria sp. TO1_6]|uniref:NUDIX hydrolase n=1 Tax=Stieleria tagensis TaxID=2956795 RepID=UPI00209B2F54|nr:NUDIX hydrolase [Stieleria tagensis]MCO8122199.1 NUDIX hydrolase [Stieleria tagensis]
MRKDLLIYCHAPVEAADLTKEGKRDAQRFGVWMRSQRLIPQQAIAASTVAAKTAAEKACKSAGQNQAIVQFRPELNKQDSQAGLDCIRSFRDDVSCGLVSVKTTVGRALCGQLCCDDLDATFKADISPGVMIHLQHDDHWRDVKSGTMQAIRTIAPATLPRLFPYPDVDGDQRRPRPAYYYRQSGVIPYRYHQGKLEVLVISTSKQKRWGVPKGIHDPGKTAQASAANEALEEAGVLGDVIDQELGRYQHQKWDAECTVTIYPMHVTEQLDESQWQESHRKRQWLSPQAASDRVHHPDLKQMIQLLPTQVSERIN